MPLSSIPISLDAASGSGKPFLRATPMSAEERRQHLRGVLSRAIKVIDSTFSAEEETAKTSGSEKLASQ